MCRKDGVEKVADVEADVMEKGQLGCMLLAGTLFRSKRVKGQLVWPLLRRRCSKIRKEGK